MVSALASSAVDRGLEPRSGQTKDYEIGICCFSDKHAALRRKSKDGLARYQNNMSECGDMPTRGLLFQWASIMKIQRSVLVQYKADLIIISLKINLLSPWYSWKIAELALNNNHSITLFKTSLTPPLFLSSCTKPGMWSVMYICVWDRYFLCFYRWTNSFDTDVGFFYFIINVPFTQVLLYFCIYVSTILLRFWFFPLLLKMYSLKKNRI
jgi:hypothetical protein